MRYKYCVVPMVAAIDYRPGKDDCFSTVARARKELTKAVREEVAECKRRHKRCARVGTGSDGVVEIRIGGRQGYHMWTRLGIMRVRR